MDRWTSWLASSTRARRGAVESIEELRRGQGLTAEFEDGLTDLLGAVGDRAVGPP
jgi:hypothetical protein